MADSNALRKTPKRKRPKIPSQKPKRMKRDETQEEQVTDLEDPSQKDQVLQQVQPGLFFSKPKFGIFLVGYYSDDFKEKLKKHSQQARNEILNAARGVVNFSLALNRGKSEEPRSRTIIAFDPDQWSRWFENDPKLTEMDLRPKGYLAQNSQKFLETGGDVFFLIKSDVQNDVEEIYDYVKENVGNFFGKIDKTESSPPSKRIIHSSFQDGIVNPSDTETLKTYVVTDDDSSSGYPGSTYLMTQKFEFNWTVLGNMHKDQKEDMIGRKTISDAFIPFTDERAHIARAHVVQDKPPIDVFERHQALFRVSMPYGTRPNEPGREEGLMYMSISNKTKQFVTILENIAGDQRHSAHGEVTVDMLISSVKPLQGTFWYIPSAQELRLESSSQERRFELQKHWDIRSPANQYIFYNQREYLYRMTTGGYSPGDTPSRRVLRLLSFSFLNWNDQWFKRLEIPNLPNLLDRDVLPQEIRKTVQEASVMIRKGWAIKKSLGSVFTTDDMSELEGESGSFFKKEYDTFSIHPDELIVGQMPVTFSLGLGKVVMPYLRENEKMPAFVKGLSESSGMGHVIPDYETLLKKGLAKMIQEIAESQASSKEESFFLRACTLALEGVQTYMTNFSLLAGHLAQKDDTSYTDAQRENLEEIKARMKKLSTDPPEKFLEAVQLIYSYHCCLHLIGEPTSIGRLDQLLEPFLKDIASEEAQEIIDCLWIKLGSQVHLNRGLLMDQQEWGTTAVPYSSNGMFPHGDTINQWVQQITVGGCKANEKKTPEDACNDITLLCLKASRRLPLNAPCLSLRMHKGIPDEVLREAAKTILSGGAHPIFPHDDRIVNGLQQIGTSDLPVSLKTARNYSCDGCYEPIFPGETQFSLAYVTLLQVLEMAINHGATYLLAGPAYLEGTPQSLPTTRADDIKTFEKVKELFATHLKVQTERQLFNTIVNYGNIAEVCPSPLLSSVVRGCLETKRDIYDAGAKFTIVGVQFISFSNTVDSLYAIKKLCFDHDSAVTSLAELVCCLKCDWGFSMKEPFHEPLAGHTRGQRLSDAFKGIRESTLALPKFGTSAGAENDDIQGIASWLAERITTIVKEVSRDSLDNQPLKGLIQSLKKKYSIPGHKWDILLPPGSGTFEGYVGWGLSCAASPDGRRAGSPIASDMSAAPTPLDLPPVPRRCDIYKALKSWDDTFIKSGLANGAEVDLKIEEHFKEEDLVTFLKRYAEGKEIGGNILTITCANPDTLANALKSPEKYDLIRVRTGGWSEFYIAFFTAHQKHQERRVYYQVTNP